MTSKAVKFEWKCSHSGIHKDWKLCRDSSRSVQRTPTIRDRNLLLCFCNGHACGARSQMKTTQKKHFWNDIQTLEKWTVAIAISPNFKNDVKLYPNNWRMFITQLETRYPLSAWDSVTRARHKIWVPNASYEQKVQTPYITGKPSMWWSVDFKCWTHPDTSQNTCHESRRYPAQDTTLWKTHKHHGH